MNIHTHRHTRSILILEDSPTQAQMLSLLLEEQGYQFILAKSGAEGLEILHHEEVMLIISDVMMPEMDGFEFCRQAKRNEATKEIPIILLTSLNDSTDIIRGLECGADNFITKPYDDEYLLNRIDYLVTNRELRKRDKLNIGVELEFAGRRHFITSERQQILDLLISTYEQAVNINTKLKNREKALEESNQRLSTLNAIGNTISQSLDLDKILNDTLEKIITLFDLDLAGIHLRDGEDIILKAEINLPPQVSAAIARQHLSETVLGVVIESEEPLVVNSQDPQIPAAYAQFEDIYIFRQLGVESFILAPLRTKGKSLGVIAVATCSQQEFSDSHIELLKNIANQLAVAIENSQLYELTRARRISEQSTLLELSQQLLASTSIEDILAKTIKAISEILKADFYGVFLPDKENKYLCLRAGQGIGSEKMRDISIAVGAETLLDAAFINSKPVFSRRDGQQSLSIPSEFNDNELTAGIAMPLVASGKTLGVLTVFNQQELQCNEDEMRCLSLIANKLAISMENLLSREALQESEEKYRLLFESNPEAMWVYDIETLRFLAVNDAAVERYGYSRAEFLAMTIKEIRPEEDLSKFEQSLSSTDLTNPNTISMRGFKHRKKDGGIIWVEVASHPIEFIDRKARLVIAHDISEKRQLEDQLRHSQKMESIGTLAGGVAHDFNNMLTAIQGFTALTARKLPNDHPSQVFLNEVLRASERAATLTRQLLAFARRQIVEPKNININNIIGDFENFLRRIIGEHIELKVIASKQLATVYADISQIEQVLMNLCVNARDAMPQGGKLLIETQNIVLDEEYCRLHNWAKPNNYVLLTLTDTGTGMDAQTQERIFELFFTTKEPGKGTGLGLSMIYGIVSQHGGLVQVYSEVGFGTTFKIYLPAVSASAEFVKREEVNISVGGTETILVVEDEPGLRSLIQLALESEGYQVLTAANGVEGLAILTNNCQPIKLILTDVVMPRMGGKELFEIVHKQHREWKFIFMSGYSVNALSENFIIDQKLELLHKPFNVVDLLRKVRTILDKSSDR